MRLRDLLLSLLLVSAPAAMQAANPTIRVDRDPPNPTVIVNDSFVFGANSLGGGDLSFQNSTGHDWFNLNIMITVSSLLPPITCGPGPFSLCTITAPPANQTSGPFTYDIFFGPTTKPAVLNGELFSINLNDDGSTDPSGAGSWPLGQDFGAKANYVAPEPAALGLGLAGGLLLAIVGVYRRRVPA